MSESQQQQFRLLVSRVQAAGIECGLIVAANRTRRVGDEARLLKALRSGVSQWMIETANGRAAFRYAGNDFNFGDLAAYLDDELESYLGAAGLECFSLIGFDFPDDLTYDTNLVDPSVGETLGGDLPP